MGAGVFQDIQTTYQVEPGPYSRIKEAKDVTNNILPALRVCGLAGTPFIEWPTSQGLFPLLSDKGSCGKAGSHWHQDENHCSDRGHIGN